MVSTLEEARKIQENHLKTERNGGYSHPVSIEREVRYYAYICGTRYALTHDWTVEKLDQRLWLRDSKPKKKRQRLKG